MILTFTIPGAPVGKGRARFSSMAGIVRAYTPAKTRHYEDLIRCEACKVMNGDRPLDEPVVMTVTAYVAIPKSFSRKKAEAANEGDLKPSTRPDIDNFCKAALDGCNAIIFRDDSLVTDLIARKRYSHRPRLVVTIETEAEAA